MRMAKTSGKNKAETGLEGQFNFVEGSYLESTSRPWYALLFLLPLVGLYEAGTQLVSAEQIAEAPRIMAFTWLMGLAEWIGMDRSMAWAFPGLVVVIILLCWHLSSQNPWRVRPGWIVWMGVESLVLTAPLFVLGTVMHSAGSCVVFAVVNDGGVATGMQEYMAKIVTSIGAGIYEELVFRLILFGLIIMVLEDAMKVRSLITVAIAVLVSAVLFAVHHYVGLQGGEIVRLEEVKIGSFVFRMVAGIYFAVIFRYRGYGITAGAHIAYDIIYFTVS